MGASFENGGSSDDMTIPPRVLDDLDAFARILGAGRVGLFSDFDGTITPIFDDPQDTTLAPAMKGLLSELSRRLELVAVVSGREVGFLRETVGLEGVTYVGNHGLEVWRPGAERPERGARIPDGLMEDVERGVEGIGLSGLNVEYKSLSVAIHYRNAADATAARSAVWRMLESLAAAHGLEVREGKMVLEIGPGVGVNKGTAVARLAREHGLSGAIVLGDDVTDCDAFDALREPALERGLMGASAAVVDGETPEVVTRKADYSLAGVGEVEEFLRWMAYAAPRAATKF